MKYLLIFYIFVISLVAKEISPFSTIKVDGLITDMVVKDGKIYVATDSGVVDIFSVNTRKKIKKIEIIPKKHSSDCKVISLDHYKNSTLVVLDIGREFREVYLIENDKNIKKIIDSSSSLLIKKVRFIDADRFVLALSSDTIITMNLHSPNIVNKIQAGGGVFRDMAVDADNNRIFVADEGGEIAVIDFKKGQIIKTLRGINVDNINHIAYKNNVILSAGQDRRVGVYQSKGSYYLESDFFVYAVGISPSAKKGVYTDGTENNLQVFTIADRTKNTRLQGGDILYDTLIFADEHLLIGSGEDNKIYFWRIP